MGGVVMSNIKLTDDTIRVEGQALYRIEAIKDIPIHGVKAGDKGGYVAKLEQVRDNAWVGDNARITGNAKVFGNAKVGGNARVFGDTWVFGNAWVLDNAQVDDAAAVYGDAHVTGNATVSGNAQLFGNAWVGGNAKVFGTAQVSDNAQVRDTARVIDNAQVSGDALVSGNAKVSGNVKVDGKDAIAFLAHPNVYDITVTRKYITVECKTIKRSEFKRITREEAVKLGLPLEHYDSYRLIIRGMMKTVKRSEKAKQ